MQQNVIFTVLSVVTCSWIAMAVCHAMYYLKTNILCIMLIRNVILGELSGKLFLALRIAIIFMNTNLIKWYKIPMSKKIKTLMLESAMLAITRHINITNQELYERLVLNILLQNASDMLDFVVNKNTNKEYNK